MADEENYSEEEFGFSEDFEEDTDDVESEELAAVEEEFESDDEEDVLGDEDTTAPAGSSGSSNLMRYGLFVVGLFALGFGGYQFYDMFSPSKPTSAFDKKSGSSMVSSLMTKQAEPKAQKDEDIPMAPKVEPKQMVQTETEPMQMAEKVQPAPEPMTSVIEQPAPTMDTMPEKPMVKETIAMPDEKMADATSSAAVSTETPMPETKPSMDSTTVPAPAPAAAPVQSASAPQAGKEVVVRYEMPTELINRQNSIESNMRTLQQRLIILEDSTRAYAEQSSTVKNDLEQITRSLKKLNSKLTKLDMDMSKVSENMHANKLMVHKKLQNMEKSMTVSDKPMHSAKEVRDAPAKYYIQAMIPGRAWIKSKKGSTITVRRGSRIMGYGRITMIDVENGIITTTSGNMIRFHPSER